MKRQFTKEEMQIVNKHFFKCASAQFKNGKLKPLQNIIFCLSNKERFPEVLKCNYKDWIWDDNKPHPAEKFTLMAHLWL